MGVTFGNETRSALAPLVSALTPTVIVSAVINVLMLAGSFFMLMVYDEVLPSRSVPTLVGLLAIVAVAYIFLALLEILRSQITGHLSAITAARLNARTLDLLANYELTHGRMPGGSQPVRDLDTIRAFLGGPGPIAFLDLPWVALFLVVLFLFHWSLAALTLGGVVVLVAIIHFSNRLIAPKTEEVSANTSQRLRAAEDIRRNAGTLRAMGALDNHSLRWLHLEEEAARLHGGLTRVAGTISATTRAFRQFLQALVLALGAYLVLIGEATGGIIIAGAILAARALAPVEQVSAQWKSAVAALQSTRRLESMFEDLPVRDEPSPLPLPGERLKVENLASGPPGTRLATIREVSFELDAGDAVAIVGRSGAGKSTLVKAVCGIWPALQGNVRLDGAAIDQYGAKSLARSIGYVPQAIELMPGTIAQNIARFEPDANMDDVIAAARAADLHGFITNLEGGYDHEIKGGGGSLSAGQMQRVAFARALYRDPFLLVLDEPNSNLDAEGETALANAITTARARGAIVLVVAHRPSILSFMSHVLIMGGGRVEQFGTTDNVKIGSQPLTATVPSRPGSPAPSAPASAPSVRKS